MSLNYILHSNKNYTFSYTLQTKAETPIDILSQPLWFNKYITIENQSLFYDQWHAKGVFLIQDIIDNDGNFMTHDQIFDTFKITCNFLQTLQLRMAIPIEWRRKISRDNLARSDSDDIKAFSNFLKRDLFASKLQCKDIYRTLIYLKCKTVNPSCIQKWNNCYHQQLKWDLIFKNPFCHARSTQLQTFQYRVVHRIITCNHWLFNAKIKD